MCRGNRWEFYEGSKFDSGVRDETVDVTLSLRFPADGGAGCCDLPWGSFDDRLPRSALWRSSHLDSRFDRELCHRFRPGKKFVPLPSLRDAPCNLDQSLATSSFLSLLVHRAFPRLAANGVANSGMRLFPGVEKKS